MVRRRCRRRTGPYRSPVRLHVLPEIARARRSQRSRSWTSSGFRARSARSALQRPKSRVRVRTATGPTRIARDLRQCGPVVTKVRMIRFMMRPSRLSQERHGDGEMVDTHGGLLETESDLLACHFASIALGGWAHRASGATELRRPRSGRLRPRSASSSRCSYRGMRGSSAGKRSTGACVAAARRGVWNGARTTLGLPAGKAATPQAATQAEAQAIMPPRGPPSS